LFNVWFFRFFWAHVSIHSLIIISNRYCINLQLSCLIENKKNNRWIEELQKTRQCGMWNQLKRRNILRNEWKTWFSIICRLKMLKWPWTCSFDNDSFFPAFCSFNAPRFTLWGVFINEVYWKNAIFIVYTLLLDILGAFNQQSEIESRL